MIATLSAELSELRFARSQEFKNETQSTQHFEKALDALIANLQHAVVALAITPPQLPCRQPMLSLLNYLGGHSHAS